MRWNDRIGRRIKLSDLHILLAVAQFGSMAKAASAIAVSHPVVSRSISELEHALGVRLLERNPHGVELTEYGRAILSRSHAAFDELRQGVKDIELLSDPTAGEVRIGSTAPLGASFVAAIIDRLSRRFPRMVFHIVSEDANSLIRDLDERKLDLLILRKIGPFAEDRQSFEVLYDNPYFVAAGAKNPWVRRRRVELAELVAELWVLPPLGSRLGSLTRDIFDAQELPYPRASVVATALEMTINLLRTDRYLAILPESIFTFPAKHPFIRKLAVELPIVSGPIGVLSLKNRVLSPAAQRFIACSSQVGHKAPRFIAVAHGRSWQIVLQKSPRRGCRIEIRNNRIEANGFLNQRCTSAHDLESILRARMRKIVLQHNRHQADLPSPHDHVRSARDSVAKLRCALRAGWLVSFWSSACAAFPLRELGHSECVCRFRMCILTQTIFTMVAEWMMLAGRRARLVRGDPAGRSAYRERDFGFMPKHSSKIATDALAAWMQRCHPFFARCRFGAKARLSRLWTETDSGCSMFPVRSRERTVRNHFKHSVELVDREGEIADVLAAVEDFLLARATYEAARQRWPKEHIRLRQETRIVEDGSDPH